MTISFPMRARPQRAHARPMLAWVMLLACGWLSAGTALAASLQVSPILLEFAPDQQAEALWLSNSGDTPIQAQVRVMTWHQADGEETLAATAELVASPPILQIAPGARQLVRIVRPRVAAPGEELAYRLIIDELPGSATADDRGLNFLLQYSVPVFVSPLPLSPPRDADTPAPPTPAVVARLQRMDGETWLSVENPGQRRVRLSQLTHVDANDTATPLAPGLLGYVLAGKRMQWPVPLTATQAGSGQLLVRFNDDQDPQPLQLAPARP